MTTDSNYRIPPKKDLILGANQPKSIQVNFCKNPKCENFGVPAKEEISRPGPNPDRDMNYKVTSTSKGAIPAIFCKSCKEKIPIKSNKGIADEFERVSQSLLTRIETLACKSKHCENEGLTIAQHPKRYQKAGMSSDKQYQVYKCKGCGQRMTASNPTRIP